MGAVHAFPALRLAGVASSPDLPAAANQFDNWQMALRRAILACVADFVAARCADEMGACGVDVAGDILSNVRRRRQMLALDVHVFGLAVRRAG